MFCPSATVSGTYTPVTESKITTSMEFAEKISGSTFSEIVETVKKYVKDNPGKSAAEITIFIVILVIGGYLILNRNRQTTPPKAKKAAATKG